MLLLSSFEQGLTTLTANTVQLVTTTSASNGYMMSKGMVRLHRATTPKLHVLWKAPHILLQSFAWLCTGIACRCPASSNVPSSALLRPGQECVLLLAYQSTFHTMLFAAVELVVMVFQALSTSLLACGATLLPCAAASLPVPDVFSLSRHHQLPAVEAHRPGSSLDYWRGHFKWVSVCWCCHAAPAGPRLFFEA